MPIWNSGDLEETDRLITFYIPLLALAAVTLPVFYLISRVPEALRYLLEFLCFLIIAGLYLHLVLSAQRKVLQWTALSCNLLLPLAIALLGLKTGGEVAGHAAILFFLMLVAWVPSLVLGEISGAALKRLQEQTVGATLLAGSQTPSSGSPIVLGVIGTLIFVFSSMSTGSVDLATVVLGILFYLAIFGLLSLSILLRKAHLTPQQPITVSGDFIRTWSVLMLAVLLLSGALATLLPKNPLSLIGMVVSQTSNNSRGPTTPGPPPNTRWPGTPGRSPRVQVPVRPPSGRPRNNERPPTPNTSQRPPSRDRNTPGRQQPSGNQPSGNRSPDRTPPSSTGERQPSQGPRPQQPGAPGKDGKGLQPPNTPGNETKPSANQDPSSSRRQPDAAPKQPEPPPEQPSTSSKQQPGQDGGTTPSVQPQPGAGKGQPASDQQPAPGKSPGQPFFPSNRTPGQQPPDIKLPPSSTTPGQEPGTVQQPGSERRPSTGPGLSPIEDFLRRLFGGRRPESNDPFGTPTLRETDTKQPGTLDRPSASPPPASSSRPGSGKPPGSPEQPGGSTGAQPGMPSQPEDTAQPGTQPSPSASPQPGSEQAPGTSPQPGRATGQSPSPPGAGTAPPGGQVRQPSNSPQDQPARNEEGGGQQPGTGTGGTAGSGTGNSTAPGQSPQAGNPPVAGEKPGQSSGTSGQGQPEKKDGKANGSQEKPGKNTAASPAKSAEKAQRESPLAQLKQKIAEWRRDLRLNRERTVLLAAALVLLIIVIWMAVALISLLRRRRTGKAREIKEIFEAYRPFDDPYLRQPPLLPERLPQAVYDAFLAYLAICRYEREPQQTEYDFVRWLEMNTSLNNQPVMELTDYFSASHYSTHPLTTEELEGMRAALQAVIREVTDLLTEEKMEKLMVDYRQAYAESEYLARQNRRRGRREKVAG
ncbi:MAG: hypothetical protein ACYC7E_01120 [Armatimonadota bacterium]